MVFENRATSDQRTKIIFFIKLWSLANIHIVYNTNSLVDFFWPGWGVGSLFLFSFSSLSCLAFGRWFSPFVSFVLLLGSFLYTSCVCFGTFFWVTFSIYLLFIDKKKKEFPNKSQDFDLDANPCF